MSARVDTGHSCKLDCTYCHAHVEDEADGGYVRSTADPSPGADVVMTWSCRPCIAAMELPWLAILHGKPNGRLRDPELAVPGWIPTDDGEWEAKD